MASVAVQKLNAVESPPSPRTCKFLTPGKKGKAYQNTAAVATEIKSTK